MRILQICSSLDGAGGVQSMIKNYYSHMDREKFRFDFIVHGDRRGGMEAWFEQYGCHIYHVPPRRVSWRRNMTEIGKVIENGNYDIVHCHQDYHGAVSLMLAKKHGVKTRIVHCHRAYPPESCLRKMRRYANTLLLKTAATDYLACGVRAAEWCYGKGCVDRGSAVVLRNAIELENYRFSEEKRKRIRKKFGLEHKIVMGHVGRFTKQKNHALLLDIFQKMHRENPDMVLVLVGDGELRKDVEERVIHSNLQESVLMLGVREDVPELLNAFDVLVFSSRFEGLSVVAIEAQANNLPVVCSGRISDEIRVSENVTFVSADRYNDAGTWCDYIDRALIKGRVESFDAVRRAGYDIKDAAGKLEEIYEKCCAENQ